MNRKEYIEMLPKEATYLTPKPPLFVHIRDLFKVNPTLYKYGYLDYKEVPKEKKPFKWWWRKTVHQEQTLNTTVTLKEKKPTEKKRKGKKEFIQEKYKAV